jgi:hypothetical protein
MTPNYVAMLYAKRASIPKRAAVDKIPLFGNMFETTITLADIAKAVSKHYNLVPGTLKFDPKLYSYPSTTRGQMFFGFNGEDADAGKPDSSQEMITGSVEIDIELHGTSIRAYAYTRIDG